MNPKEQQIREANGMMEEAIAAAHCEVIPGHGLRKIKNHINNLGVSPILAVSVQLVRIARTCKGCEYCHKPILRNLILCPYCDKMQSWDGGHF